MQRRLELENGHRIDLSLRTLKLFGSDPALRVRRHESLWALRLSSGAATLYLEHPANAAHAEIEAWGEGAAEALERLPALVGCDDLAAERFAPTLEPLRGLDRGLRGLRLPRSGAAYDVLVRTVIEQKVSGKEAYRSFRQLVAEHGEPAPGPGGLRLPPSPARLAELDWAELHPLGLEQRRARVLNAVARFALRFGHDLPAPTPGVEERLAALPGIGPWTLAKMRRHAWGDADAVEVGDYNLPSTVAWNLAREPRADDRRMLELLEPYRGHRGRVIAMLMLSGQREPRYGPRRELRRLDRR
jgi:3-methyladenine DNA glycosylase/8-oxoguanine DNA glycosylase